MSDGHWNCWIFTNGGKESRFSTEVIHSLVVHAIMTVRISIVLKNTVIFTFRGVPLLYCYNCQFQHSQYCFAINEKNNQGYKIHVHVKKGIIWFEIFLCVRILFCELSAFNVKPYCFIQLNPGWAWAEWVTWLENILFFYLPSSWMPFLEKFLLNLLIYS